jgi:hypothetical protein
MKTLNRLTISLLSVLFAAMSPVHADDNTMTQTRDMTRDREQINLQTPTSDFAQSQERYQERYQEQNREQHREQHQSRNQHQNGMMERSVHDISVTRSATGSGAAGGGMNKGR